MANDALLNIDESNIEINLLFTEKNQEDDGINILLKSFNKPGQPSVTFCPLPGACVKCKCENGEKVFLNICQTLEIPPPEDISEEKILQLLTLKDPSWRIPMSIGHEKFEVDKGGAKCPTYDIAMNTKFFEKCQANDVFLTFVIHIIISAIQEKHDRPIMSENYVILKNRKVMGKLHDHRVQKRELNESTVHKPLIEELPDFPRKSSKSIDQENLEYIILRRPKMGQVKALIGYYKLPNWHRIKDVRVTIGEDRIIVEAPKTDFLVDVFIPYTLDQDNVTAYMDQNLNGAASKIELLHLRLHLRGTVFRLRANFELPRL